MKKVISVLLSVIVFLGGIVCPKISAGGVDKEVYLKDGTKLTYISSEKMYKAKEWIEGKIKENREKIFSVAANTGIKLGSAVIGTLDMTLIRTKITILTNSVSRVGLTGRPV